MNQEIDYSIFEKKLKPKYILDRIIALPLLLFSSPLILLSAFLIKLDGWLHPEHSGSVFYTEPRISAGKIFNIIKFRTVPEDIVRWIKESPSLRSITGCDSSRRTCAGRFILKWYLDEIPQLINIARGEMSFVGPRPHIIKQTEEEIRCGYHFRNMLKAGLFGVPQACKRHPKYRAILEQMAKNHKPNIEVLNNLDGLYAKKCLSSNIFGLLLFDFIIISRCFVVIVRGS